MEMEGMEVEGMEVGGDGDGCTTPLYPSTPLPPHLKPSSLVEEAVGAAGGKKYLGVRGEG